jgi:SPP1 family predicted phage head-tail adaptor
MNFHLTIMSPTDTATTGGNYLRTWTKIGGTWAWIKEMNAQERTYAAQIGSVITHEISVRFTDLINTKCRLIFFKNVAVPLIALTEDELTALCSSERGIRQFEITGVIDPDGRKQELKISSVEKAAV